MHAPEPEERAPSTLGREGSRRTVEPQLPGWNSRVGAARRGGPQIPGPQLQSPPAVPHLSAARRSLQLPRGQSGLPESLPHPSVGPARAKAQRSAGLRLRAARDPRSDLVYFGSSACDAARPPLRTGSSQNGIGRPCVRTQRLEWVAGVHPNFTYGLSSFNRWHVSPTNMQPTILTIPRCVCPE